MTKAVLDTNVVVSGLLNPEGNEALVLKLAGARAFRCYISQEILSEYEVVLGRARFDLKQRHITRLMAMFRKTATVVDAGRTLRVTLDRTDNKFLECAVEARADYLVTGNVRHFPTHFQDIRVFRPRQFLEILASQPR